MAAGERRMWRPRTDEERKVRHKRFYGKNSPLPPRGTGLAREAMDVANVKKLLKRSTHGSGSFSESELKDGFRKIAGTKLNYCEDGK